MNFPKLDVGCYQPSEYFFTIPEHVAVKYAETDGLVAVTGPGGDLESWKYARLFAAAPDFLNACAARSHRQVDVTPLEWLSGLLTDLENTNWAASTEDPAAAWNAIDAARGLLDNLKSAVEKAQAPW